MKSLPIFKLKLRFVKLRPEGDSYEPKCAFCACHVLAAVLLSLSCQRFSSECEDKYLTYNFQTNIRYIRNNLYF